jgi:hypothetical protein
MVVFPSVCEGPGFKFHTPHLLRADALPLDQILGSDIYLMVIR